MLENVVLKATTGYHDVTTYTIAEIPMAIADPVIIFKGSVDGSLFILTELTDQHGDNVAIALALNRYQNRLRVNKITSIYGKEKLESYIENHHNDIMYANKEKTFALISSRGLQLPKLVQSLSNVYINSISDKNGKSETENAHNGEQKGKYALSKSIEDMSLEELSEAYTESVEERQAIASYLKDGAAVPTATKTRSMTKELLNEFGSNYDVENASALVHNLYMELSTGFDKDGNKLTESEIDSHIERTAKRFIKASTETNTDLFEESTPMRQKIRNTEILISENDIEDFGSREDFNEFKKSNFGRMPKLKVADTAGNVDKVYQELSSEYPDFFPLNISIDIFKQVCYN